MAKKTNAANAPVDESIALLEGTGIENTDTIDLSGAIAQNYVGFYHPLSPNADDITSQCGKMKEAAPVLHVSGQFTALNNPFNLLLVTNKVIQHYAETDNVGAIVRSYRRPKPNEELSEVIDCLILLFHDKKLIPCTMRFKTSRALGIKKAIKNYNDVKANLKNDWENSKLPEYCFLVHSIETSSRLNRAKTNNYMITSCNSKNITASDLKIVTNNIVTEEFKEAFTQCAAALDNINNQLLD